MAIYVSVLPLFSSKSYIVRGLTFRSLIHSQFMSVYGVNLRYADDTTFTAESEEELKSFLMKVKEESKKLA